MDISVIITDAAGAEDIRHFSVPDDADESAFWKTVSDVFIDAPFPSTVRVTCPKGEAELEIKPRGSRVVNGVEVPSPVVTPVENSIALPPTTYGEAYLTCVSAESKGGHGSYKFYRLIPRADGIHAEWGRIGESVKSLRTPYPSWMYHVKVAEKLAKSYRDCTDLCVEESDASHAPVAAGAGACDDSEDTRLFAKLYTLARICVRHSLIDDRVTAKQVEVSEALLDELRAQGDVKSFNGVLLRLMAIAPRRTGNVSSFLARADRDFVAIIGREEALVNAMRTVVDARKDTKATSDSFASFGIAVRKATDEEIERDVRPNLRDHLNRMVKGVWAIDPAVQRERFERRCAERGIGADGVRLLWHGSRNENWCSIIEHSLMLNPNAVRTGSMFGQGLYFSLEGGNGRGEKSFNYTSYCGSYWARGNESEGFMGLFACAYGRPMQVTTCNYYSQDFLDRSDCDCVHAVAGTGFLRNDEIVFYREDAVMLKYLVQFA